MVNVGENAGSAARRVVTLAIFAYCLTDFSLQAKAASIVTKEQAMKYLTQYGYTSPIYPWSKEMTFMDDPMSSAVSKFQDTMGLDVTGKLDAKTSDMMTIPRCGVPDMGELKMGRRVKRESFRDSKWNHTKWTYRIDNYPRTLNHTLVHEVIVRAFALWSEYANLTFSLTNETADIEISFHSNSHGDGNPFDGPGQTLAHILSSNYRSYVHFDDDEVWSTNDSRGYSFLHLAAHEFGHALGLQHSNNESDVMYPYFNKYKPNTELHENDILGIQAFYGPKVIELPRICEDPSIDTMFTSTDGHTYAFKGSYYWKLTTYEITAKHPKLIFEKWKGLPGKIDAAITYDQFTFFFKGSQYWRYVDDQMADGFPRQISQGFPGIPDDIDAATVWTGDGKIYFFKGAKFWRFDSGQLAHSGSISKWKKGLPNNLDAAVVYNGNTYFFKGGSYYRFNDKYFSVDRGSPDFPRPNGLWFDCQLLSDR